MRNRALQLLLGVALASCLHVSTADAQATRTWVSGVGDDANPCSRTAPCKTFPGAISKTAAGGEINCLDPGGFGGVTITKAITIDCTGTFGSSLVSGTNGVVVNAPAGSIITLRGISIFGAGTGLSGIRFLAGGALHVEHVKVSGFRSATGKGLDFVPSTPNAELHVTDSSFLDNGTAAGGLGILIQPSAGGSATAVLNRVQMVNNFGNLSVNATSGAVSVTVKDSIASNSTGGIGAVSTGQTLRLMIDRTILSNNTNALGSNGAGSAVFISNSVLSNNNTAMNFTAPGTLLSFSNNLVAGNNNDGAPSGTIAPK
jgi:hypothetical protein